MKRLLTVLAGCLIAASAAHAQVGTIVGTVSDEANDPLPGANITVTGNAIASARGATTDLEGHYRIPNLPVGSYEIAASFIGFRTVRQIVHILETRSEIELHFQMHTSDLIYNPIVVTASRGAEKIIDAPASISAVSGSEFQDRVPLTIAEMAQTEGAVDYSKTGLVQNNTVVRGFNNVFSGALLTLTDYRIAAVPSLRINANYFIPANTQDVERIEVARGPASALYGPNSANGLMHIITRSPIGSEGTVVGLSGGERSVRNLTFRHASSREGRVGFKVSGQYYAGADWEYVDPEELRANDGVNPRDYDIEKFTGEARVDFRPNVDTDIIFTTGMSQMSNVEQTGLGAGQVIDWRYLFGQARVHYKDWFFQAYHNASDAGDTFLLRQRTPTEPQGGAIIDKSSLTVVQLQHGAELGEKQRFIYGADMLLTRPATEGTITGANEDSDDINEFGYFLQSETALNEKIDLILTGRYDTHNHIDDGVFSPRGALIFKPDADQAFRFTYNRAFSTPTTNNLFLDIEQGSDIFGIGAAFQPALGYRPDINIRTQGTVNGFTFRRDGAGLPMFRSPFSPVAGQQVDAYQSLHDPVFTNVMWGVARRVTLGAFVPQFQAGVAAYLTGVYQAQGVPPDDAAARAQADASRIAAAFPGIVPAQLPGLRNTLATLNLETRGFDATAPGDVLDIERTKPTITNTIEVGYKGILQKKLFLSVDAYWTQIEDFVGPLRIETPNVFLDAASLGTALGPAFAAALADTNNAELASALATLDVPQAGGNGNGTPVDELTTIFVAGTAQNGAAYIPFGTVTTEQASDPTAVALTYRNFGKVDFWGFDFAAELHATDQVTLIGNYSYVSEDLFPNLGGLSDIALNAPKQKVNLGIRWTHPQGTLRLGGNVRYRSSFPMNSGVYVGTVESYTAVDLSAVYDLPFNNRDFKASLSLNGSNVLDQEHAEFVGAPELGRLVTAGVVVRF